MLSILITNAYSAQNRGDAGIILGMLEDLRDNPFFADAEVTVSTQDYPGDVGRYPCRVVPSFHSIKNRFSTRPTLNGLCFLLLLLPLSFVWALAYRITGASARFGGQFGLLMGSYTAADIIIAAGGGYLYTTSRRQGLVILLIQLYSFYLGALLGKPVYLYSQSIGPFGHPLHAALTRKALKRTRLVQLREGYSYRLVESWQLRNPIHATVDAGFLTPVESAPVCIPANCGRVKIGVTVRRWFREERDQAEFEETVSRFLQWLTEDQGAYLFFLPQVTATHAGDDDRLIARALLTSLRHAQLLEADLSAPQLKSVTAQMDLVVATRLHSAVFAVAMGVPCLTIAYQPKAYGIMEQLSMTPFWVPIDELSLCRLQSVYLSLSRAAEEIRARLRQRIPELCQEARQNSRIISEDYRQRSGPRALEAAPRWD